LIFYIQKSKRESSPLTGEGETAVKCNKDAILVVDDDRELTEIICNCLAAELPDATFLKAYDGSEAIDVFNKHLPAVVILDLMLPKRSGFLVAENICRQKEQSDSLVSPVVIMITGNHGERHRQYALKMGVWKYLYKPFRIETLFELVQEAQKRGRER